MVPLFDKLRTHDANLSDEFLDNRLILKACTIRLLNLLLPTAPTNSIISAAIVAAAPRMPIIRERWTGIYLTDLIRSAVESLELQGLQLRHLPKAEKAKPATTTGEMASLKEELDLLWWCWNKYSPTAGKYYVEMPIGTRLCLMALDAANSILMPPTQSIRNIFRNQVRKNLEEEDTSALSVNQLEGAYLVEFMSDATRQLVLTHEFVFPVMAYLTSRADALGNALRDPADWAMQLLNELVLSSIVATMEKD